MSEPRPAGPTEIDLPGLEDEISAAFDSIRAEPLGARSPGQATREGRDRRARHANRDAFLIMEHERRKLAERLHERREISERLHVERQRKPRYRDLLLITNLIAVEYEHLSGRAGRGKSLPPLLEGHLPERDTPAYWARPWGTGPLFELRSSLKTYLRRRDRAAGRISARARKQAAGEAEKEMDRIYTSSRLQTITGRWKFEAGAALLPAAEPEQPAEKPAPSKSKEREERLPQRDRKRSELRERKKAEPKRKPLPKTADRVAAAQLGRRRKRTVIRTAAAVAVALLIGAGIALLLYGGGSSKSAAVPAAARAAAIYDPLVGRARVPTRAEVAAHRRAVERARELAQRRQEARAARLAAEQAAAARARKHRRHTPTPVPSTPPPAPVSTPSPPPSSQPTQAPSQTQTSTQTKPPSPAPAPAPAPSPAPAPAK